MKEGKANNRTEKKIKANVIIKHYCMKAYGGLDAGMTIIIIVIQYL
jgi:hypothetical protein